MHLPTEILSEIFLTHISSIKSDEIRHSNGVLSLVCRDWRQLVIFIPQLWTVIYFDLENNAQRIPIRLIDLFLERSTDTLLEIIFPGARDPDLASECAFCEYTSAAFDRLIHHIHRWRRFTFDTESVFSEIIQRIPFSKADQLKFVDASTSFWCSKTDIPVLSGLVKSPHLRSLKWTTESLGAVGSIASIAPLGRLTCIDIQCRMSAADVFHLMRCCGESVVEIGIGFFMGLTKNDEDFDRRPVALPHLRTLSLLIDDTDYPILQSFDFPNLQVLSIVTCWWLDSVSYPPPPDIAPIFNYLSNSRHSLQVLSIRNPKIHAFQIYSLISSSNILGLPIVQLYTRSPPDHVQSLIRDVVGQRIPQRELIFKQTSVSSNSGPVQNIAMGWIDQQTLSSLDRFLVNYDRRPLNRGQSSRPYATRLKLWTEVKI